MLIKVFFKLINIIFINIFLFYSISSFAISIKDFGLLHTLHPIVKKTLPSIVSISGIKKIDNLEVMNDTLSDIMDNFDDKDNKRDNILEKIGSGVIIDKKKGLIITNAHVISNLDKINIMLSNNHICSANIIGLDYYSDLALIKIHNKNIKSIRISNSDKIRIGDFVIAIGNPYGFSHTVTYGVVSALCRNNISLNNNGYYNFIQTDAAINQGNSGGGLFNMKGDLIGINTAMVTTKQGGNMGLGLSIPSNMVRIISHQLKKGEMKRGLLGLSSQDLTKELAISFNYQKNYGAIISQIYPNTAAHESELKIGDIITHINRKKIIDSMHLRIMISLIIPDKKITLNVFRKNKLKKIDVVIRKKNHRKVKGKSIFKGFGNTELIEKLNNGNLKVQGIIVDKIDKNSPSKETSLKKGDLIIAANKVLTPSIEILKRVALKHKNILLLQVLRDKTKFFIVIRNK